MISLSYSPSMLSTLQTTFLFIYLCNKCSSSTMGRQLSLTLHIPYLMYHRPCWLPLKKDSPVCPLLATSPTMVLWLVYCSCLHCSFGFHICRQSNPLENDVSLAFEMLLSLSFKKPQSTYNSLQLLPELLSPSYLADIICLLAQPRDSPCSSDTQYVLCPGPL